MATRNETYATRNELNSAPYDINSTRNETIPRLDYTDIWDKTNSANLQMNSRPFPYIYYIFRHTESPDLSNCIKSEAMDPPCSNWPPNTNMADELLYIHRRVVNTGTYNYAAARIPLPTKLNIEYLHRNLANYHDNEVVQFLKFGWPINYDKSTLPISKLGNHKGAREYPSHVDTFIKTEVDHRATIGPFTTNPFMFNTSISPLNTAPKRDPSERRVILDLSYPRGRSVNDGIPSNSYVDEQFRLSYPSVDSLCAMIRSKGRGCHIYKLDLTRAYRQLMVDPSDYPFLTYQWRGNFFADTVFPFGLRSASMACQRTTEALRYIHNSHGFPSIVFLDDFCGAETVDRSNDAFEDIRKIIQNAGFKEAIHKAEPPSTTMTFLGVLFDTNNMTMEVTPGRLAEIASLLEHWKTRKKCKKRELQSLIGKLQFVAKCVPPGRLFICRLLDMLRKYKSGHHYVTLNREFHRHIMVVRISMYIQWCFCDS